MPIINCQDGCLQVIGGDCVKYTGPQINNPSIVPNTTFNQVVQILANAVVVGVGSIVTGSRALSGDGILTDFTIPHSLTYTPVYFIAQAASLDARGISYVTTDNINITIHYDVAPPIGSNNIIINWSAK